MAYYAALISLRKTIQHHLNSSRISILPLCREILQFAFEVVATFQLVLETNEEIMIKNSSNEKVWSLNGQITEAAYRLEDALEYYVSNQYEISLGDHECSSHELFLDLTKLKKEIDSFTETIKKIEKMMMEELRKPLPEEEDDNDDIPSKLIDFGGKNSKMVGLSEEFNKLKYQLIRPCTPWNVAISIVGMAGIGKTALAMKLFEDPSISSHFGARAFVTIGPKYRFKKVMLSILAQLNQYDINEIRMEEDEILAEYIRTSLQGRRYLIVLDDVWSKKHLFELQSLLPARFCKEVVTTRQKEVAKNVAGVNVYLRRGESWGDYVHDMRFLSKEESWDLLREKVFGEGYLCPFQLEKFGKKIAENCEGLPLTIVTVANILSKEEKTLEYWKKVAENENSVFTDAYDQMWEVLISSYNYLPQLLKPCFLYMGVFPLRREIRASKLVKLWHADRFLDEYSAKDCLRKLASASIVLVNEWSSSVEDIKTCSLHTVYWHLCVKEASKENFLHVIKRRADTKGIKNQRRLCIHNNVLFGIKEVRNSVESISMAHSLLCTGPYHQYPVPIWFGLRMLRVLDALTIRLYKFPIEVLKLVLLRYLALTYCGKVPGSISKLWNLEHLIIHRHMSINKSSEDSTHLPVEIWNMKELRHIQVTGGTLPDPCGSSLPNLLTLSDMSVNSCSKEILEKIPNLKKLGIQIELTPDATEPLHCIGDLSHFRRLISFKCVVMNPKPRSHVVACLATFPFQLKKLSLSGLGYPWEYMRIIAKLPVLEVLKLRCYAFQGPVWEIHDREFLRLKYLLLEDTDLVRWRWRSSSDNFFSRFCRFPQISIRRLIITHCYKLKEIPSSLRHRHLELLKIVDCPSLEAFVEQSREEYEDCDIHVHSSLDDEK